MTCSCTWRWPTFDDVAIGHPHVLSNYQTALAKGLELLYAAGDPGEIELACEDMKPGWQDEQALYFHRSLLEQMPPVLRAYVGCATTLFGDVAQADVVKLHKASGKVTFLVYDDFENARLPQLKQRIKVKLRTRWVQVFDHSAEGQFDRGLWSIADDYRVMVNREKFIEEGVPGQKLADFDGHRLFLPGDPKHWPEPTFLAWHRERKFTI